MDEKLKIAIEALLEIKDLYAEETGYAYHVQRISANALHAIRLKHYLAEPSPVIAERIGGFPIFREVTA